MKPFASTIQIVGLALITIAVGFWSLIAAGVVFGVTLVAVGIALELR